MVNLDVLLSGYKRNWQLVDVVVIYIVTYRNKCRKMIVYIIRCYYALVLHLLHKLQRWLIRDSVFISVLRFVFIIKAIFTILEDEDVIFMKATITLKYMLITDLDIIIVTFYDFMSGQIDWSFRLMRMWSGNEIFINHNKYLYFNIDSN